MSALVDDAVADEVLGRFWDEALRAIQNDETLSQLAAMIPPGKEVGIAEVIPILTVVLTTPVLKGSARQLAALDTLGHAYARARGLHFTED